MWAQPLDEPSSWALFAMKAQVNAARAAGTLDLSDRGQRTAVGGQVEDLRDRQLSRTQDRKHAFPLTGIAVAAAVLVLGLAVPVDREARVGGHLDGTGAGVAGERRRGAGTVFVRRVAAAD